MARAFLQGTRLVSSRAFTVTVWTTSPLEARDEGDCVAKEDDRVSDGCVLSGHANPVSILVSLLFGPIIRDLIALICRCVREPLEIVLFLSVSFPAPV